MLLLRKLKIKKNFKFYSNLKPKKNLNFKKELERGVEEEDEDNIFEQNEILTKKIENFEEKFIFDTKKLEKEVRNKKRENIEERIRNIENLISKLPDEEKPKYNYDFQNLKEIKRKFKNL